MTEEMNKWIDFDPGPYTEIKIKPSVSEVWAGKKDGAGKWELPEGRKDDTGKLRYDLIPPYAIEQLAAIYTYGAHYGDRNWEKGIRWGRVFAAIMRHLWAFWRGEDNDPESGIHHCAHAAWGCFALIEYSASDRKLIESLDDRPKGKQ